MKKTAVVTLILFLMAGIAYADGYVVKKKAGEYEVEFKIDKDKPSVGENKVEIKIKDATGKYVTNAEVNLYYFMSSMPAMNNTTDTILKGDRYTAVIKLMMAGVWDLDLKFKRSDGKPQKVTISLEVK